MPRLQQEEHQLLSETSQQEKHPLQVHPQEHQQLEETSQQKHPQVHPQEHQQPEETSQQEHQQPEETSQQEHPQNHPLLEETSQLVEIPRQKEIIQTNGNQRLLQQHGRAQPRQIQQHFLPANASTRVAALSTTVGANVLTSPRTSTGGG